MDDWYIIKAMEVNPSQGPLMVDGNEGVGTTSMKAGGGNNSCGSCKSNAIMDRPNEKVEAVEEPPQSLAHKVKSVIHCCVAKVAGCCILSFSRCCRFKVGIPVGDVPSITKRVEVDHSPVGLDKTIQEDGLTQLKEQKDKPKNELEEYDFPLEDDKLAALQKKRKEHKHELMRQKDKLKNELKKYDLLPDAKLAALQKKKKELKHELKAYDMAFARKHGRMPLKTEKEQIRHLYENYNFLKTTILAAGGTAPVVRVVNSNTTTAKNDEALTHCNADMKGDCVAILKEEKVRLHQFIGSFEKKFFNEHHRHVSSFRDIKPEAAKYRKYKEIKTMLSNHQGKKCYCFGCYRPRQNDIRLKCCCSGCNKQNDIRPIS